MNFVEADSQRNHNASEIAYRVAYISRWNSIDLELNFK
jgi:hypothetical protein